MQKSSPGELILYSCRKDAGVPVGTSFGPVVRQAFIIECCTEGEARHIVNGKPYPLSAGQAMVFFPGDSVIHETVGHVPRRGWWCHVGGEGAVRAFAAAGIRSDAPYLPAGAAAEVTRLLRRIEEMNRENDPGAEWRRKGLLFSAFGEILRAAPVRTERSVYVSRAVGMMESCCAEPLDVAKIARGIGLDRSYFSTLFRRETGVSPKEYLTRLRIGRASALLRSTDLPVGEIALSCGFAPESFSRVFTRKTGKTPLRYRRGK